MDQKTLEHVKHIWDILQETRGFDQGKLLALLPRLLAKPETQQMGQKIVGGLVQKLAVRLLREFLLTNPRSPQTPEKVPYPISRPALPPVKSNLVHASQSSPSVAETPDSRFLKSPLT